MKKRIIVDEVMTNEYEVEYTIRGEWYTASITGNTPTQAILNWCLSNPFDVYPYEIKDLNFSIRSIRETREVLDHFVYEEVDA